MARASTSLPRNFYPRPPRGGRLLPLMSSSVYSTFLSTPSARRATRAADGAVRPIQISIHALREEGDRKTLRSKTTFLNFYPRPPRGGRRELHDVLERAREFLSTPSARRATPFLGVCGRAKAFLSTPSARRATFRHPPCADIRSISIHALREEGDGHFEALHSPLLYFYPRPPRGGRQQKQRQNLYFQTNYTTFCTNLEEP